MFSPSSLHHSIAQVGLLSIFWSIWWKMRFPPDAFQISSCPFGCLNCWCNPRIRRFRRNWFCFERSMSIQNGWQCIVELFIKTVSRQFWICNELWFNNICFKVIHVKLIDSSVCYLFLGCMTMQWSDKPSDGKMEDIIWLADRVMHRSNQWPWMWVGRLACWRSPKDVKISLNVSVWCDGMSKCKLKSPKIINSPRMDERFSSRFWNWSKKSVDIQSVCKYILHVH